MNVINFLKEKGLDALSDLGIEILRYPNGYVKLNYSQIESPKNHPVADECRGLVLFLDGGGWKVITRPFKRFYNYGECNTLSTFSFFDVSVYEKADGTLVTLSWSPVDNEFILGTRGMAYAEGPFGDSFLFKTFKDAIMNAVGISSLSECQSLKDNLIGLTLVFEYIGPENRIVTPYKKSELVLLAVFNNESGEELELSPFFELLKSNGFNVRVPVIYHAKNPEEVFKLVSQLENLQEGVVVKNKLGERVKVKSRAYLAAHRMRGNCFTLNSAIDLFLSNEHKEFLSYFQEYGTYFEKVERALDKALTRAENDLQLNSHLLDSKKDFGTAISKTPMSALVFSMVKNNLSARECFLLMPKSYQINTIKENIC